MLGPLLGGWERWVAGASPVAALQKLSQTSDAAPERSGAWAAGRRCGWSAAMGWSALMAAARCSRRRDA